MDKETVGQKAAATRRVAGRCSFCRKSYRYVGPLVETAPQEKALSIALREINSDLIEFKPSES